MQIEKLNSDFTVCKISKLENFSDYGEIFFIAKTDEEISLLCETKKFPKNFSEREDGWKGFKISGILDFSLIGILAKISALLAENKISIFAVSTFNTDYFFVKQKNFTKAIKFYIAQVIKLKIKECCKCLS